MQVVKEDVFGFAEQTFRFLSGVGNEILPSLLGEREVFPQARSFWFLLSLIYVPI